MGCSISCHYFKVFSYFLCECNDMRPALGPLYISWMTFLLWLGFIPVYAGLFSESIWSPIVIREDGGPCFHIVFSRLYNLHSWHNFLSPSVQCLPTAGSNWRILFGPQGHPPPDEVGSRPTGLCLLGDAYGQAIFALHVLSPWPADSDHLFCVCRFTDLECVSEFLQCLRSV